MWRATLIAAVLAACGPTTGGVGVLGNLAGDRDGDNRGDGADQCSDDPEDWDDFDNSDGCPDR